MDQEPWYAAKCLFRHHDKESGPKQMYEERVILLKATSLDEAVARPRGSADHRRRGSSATVRERVIQISIDI
jgi:hypothetical protein